MADPDPLCPAHAGRDTECMCRALRTARLQGPVKDNRHPPICWCQRCQAASVEIHGEPI